MKKQSFLKSLSPDNRYLVLSVFSIYLAQGIYIIMIGSALPMIKAEYQIGYQVGGMLLSVQSIGYLIMGAVTGILPKYIGMKRTILILTNFAFVGLVIMMVTGNPVLLLFAMLMTGISKGATTNFNNQIVTTLSGGDAGALNLLHACFAIGACIAPLIVLACGESWRMAFGIEVAIGIIFFLFNIRLKVGPEVCAQEEKGKPDFGFFGEKIFWLCTILMLGYQSIEASIMGWLVTFFVDSGTVESTAAQLLTSALWISLLIGRFSISIIAKKFKPYQMITVMIIGIAVFFTMMMTSNTLIPMIVATIGLGLCMAGMYGTIVANGGDLFDRYPMCMGVFVTIPGIGATIAPSAIGAVSDHVGIRGGMSVLFIAAAVLLVTGAVNLLYQRRRSEVRVSGRKTQKHA
ncbi:MAG: MFS transporter [Butyricicoccaceae bacterium]